MGNRAGFTLGELAEALQATLEGDPARIVTGVEALDAAGPEHISFLIDPRYAAAAAASRAGAFLTGHDAGGLPAPLLRTAKPQQALIRLLTLFHPPAPATAGIDPTAVVAADARVDPTAAVGPLGRKPSPPAHREFPTPNEHDGSDDPDAQTGPELQHLGLPRLMWLDRLHHVASHLR